MERIVSTQKHLALLISLWMQGKTQVQFLYTLFLENETQISEKKKKLVRNVYFYQIECHMQKYEQIRAKLKQTKIQHRSVILSAIPLYSFHTHETKWCTTVSLVSSSLTSNY